MISAFSALPAKRFDVCIVGGGAAGLTLAASLIDSGLSVLLLEAGGAKETKLAQALYEGELVDPAVHPWLHHFRVRAVGGSSRIWGGRCIPYDAIDFAARDWVPGPGWPITFDTLKPYYVAAQAAAEAGPFEYDPAKALPGRQGPMVPGLDGDKIQTRLERFSKPTNFWLRFGDVLTAAPNVTVVLNASVTGVRLAADGKTVDHLDVVDASGAKHAVQAQRYVLALGGLETTRLLLASNDILPAGVGNHSDHLGRHYMSHLAATAGEITFSAPPEAIAFDYERDAEDVYVRRRLAISDAAQRELRMLNVVFRTHLPEISDPSHRDPILSSMFLVKNLLLYEYSRKFRAAGTSWRHQLAHVGNILRAPGRLARFAIRWVRDRNLAERKLPSVVLGSPSNRFALEFHAEQAPSAASRLTLCDTRDALGMLRLRADWRTTPLDMESLRKAYALLASELERTGTGHLDYDPDALAATALAEGAYGGHHLGAARMSKRPEDGVVDIDCRVHGMDDLYVASGAVLPTSSQANPTLTILALTLRIADGLRRDLDGRESS